MCRKGSGNGVFVWRGPGITRVSYQGPWTTAGSVQFPEAVTLRLRSYLPPQRPKGAVRGQSCLPRPCTTAAGAGRVYLLSVSGPAWIPSGMLFLFRTWLSDPFSSVWAFVSWVNGSCFSDLVLLPPSRRLRGCSGLGLAPPRTLSGYASAPAGEQGASGFPPSPPLAP